MGNDMIPNGADIRGDGPLPSCVYEAVSCHSCHDGALPRLFSDRQLQGLTSLPTGNSASELPVVFIASPRAHVYLFFCFFYKKQHFTCERSAAACEENI